MSSYSISTTSPSEDRSVNDVKTTDSVYSINVVFDGHGGSRAVESADATRCSEITAIRKVQRASSSHLCSSLCHNILTDITLDSFSDEAHTITNSAFFSLYEEISSRS